MDSKVMHDLVKLTDEVAGKVNQAKQLATNISFDFGDTVVFNNKVGKDEGIVCNVRLCPGCILYSVVWSDKTVKDHYDFELKLKET